MKGLFIPHACRDNFYFLALKRQWRYVTYMVEPEEKDSIQIDFCGLRESTFDQFTEQIPEDMPRWIIYDFEYDVKEFGIE